MQYFIYIKNIITLIMHNYMIVVNAVIYFNTKIIMQW